MMPSPVEPAPAPDSAMVSVSLCARLLAASASVRAGTSTWTSAAVGSPGFQRQLADGEPVAVGGGEGELVAVDLEPDAGEHRQRVVAAGGDRDLGDGGRELGAVDRAGGRRHARQLRVVVDRHASAG